MYDHWPPQPLFYNIVCICFYDFVNYVMRTMKHIRKQKVLKSFVTHVCCQLIGQCLNFFLRLSKFSPKLPYFMRMLIFLWAVEGGRCWHKTQRRRIYWKKTNTWIRLSGKVINWCLSNLTINQCTKVYSRQLKISCFYRHHASWISACMSIMHFKYILKI